ncbi:MAG: dephospho-CoA kinase [Thermoguttaceae bacterium]
MEIIGLLGGIASGKSTVAAQLADCGAKIVDADKIGHEVLRSPEIEAAARERWGSGIFGPDGRIERRKLAHIVFAPGPEAAVERTFLEQLTHPEIIRQLKEQLRLFATSGEKVAVLDAALLDEAGLHGLCDKLVFVDAPWETRLRRALNRGWRKKDFEAREGWQKSLDFKRNRADLLIDNSGSSEHTRAQIERFWQTLLSESRLA